MTDSWKPRAHPENLRRVVIEPVSRVEGHGKVTLLLDADNRVQQARLHIVEFRGFEKFVQGRPYWEVPVLVQRLCGICPVSHHLAASKAMDMIVGATESDADRREDAPPAALRPDPAVARAALLPSGLAGPAVRLRCGCRRAQHLRVAAANPELAKQGVLLRKYGQEVIRVTSGKRVHGIVRDSRRRQQAPDAEERDYLLADIERTVAWSQEAVALIKRLYSERKDFLQRLRLFPLGVREPRPRRRRARFLPRRPARPERRTAR